MAVGMLAYQQTGKYIQQRCEAQEHYKSVFVVFVKYKSSSVFFCIFLRFFIFFSFICISDYTESNK